MYSTCVNTCVTLNEKFDMPNIFDMVKVGFSCVYIFYMESCKKNTQTIQSFCE